jgi:hypothetical protein
MPLHPAEAGPRRLDSRNSKLTYCRAASGPRSLALSAVRVSLPSIDHVQVRRGRSGTTVLALEVALHWP